MCIQEELRNSDPVIREMAREMKAKFDKYWENYSMILSFAVILDPRYKAKIVEYAFTKLGMKDNQLKEKVEGVINGLKNLYKEYEICSNVGGGSSKVGNDLVDDLDEFDLFQSKFIIPENEKSQLDLYLVEPSLDRKMDIDVLHYWRENQGRYPQLALMARDILSIPITTVASESSFSIGGQIISKCRSSLLSKNAEALLCTRDWLFDLDDEDDSDEDGVDEEQLIEDIEALIPTLESNIYQC
ncbi:zinc finger BED domain-containing protein DAYSLEEPER-like [Rutidosis leptorrhynchoides]|uniref:zinc finger BED domain-containing protein DAYSLEEPER-like n=1 Tax=Rutidosis leptorrhynchoides TaxID=125765 RepID=UPI003A9A3C71